MKEQDIIESKVLYSTNYYGNKTESLTHFSGWCHKRCRSIEMSDEQAQMKKLNMDLVLSKEMFTFAPDDESLKRLVAHRRVFIECIS